MSTFLLYKTCPPIASLRCGPALLWCNCCQRFSRLYLLRTGTGFELRRYPGFDHGRARSWRPHFDLRAASDGKHVHTCKAYTTLVVHGIGISKLSRSLAHPYLLYMAATWRVSASLCHRKVPDAPLYKARAECGQCMALTNATGTMCVQ